jgi:hypothetical protein
VSFVAIRWEDLLGSWDKSAKVAGHVAGLRDRFGALG